jgi:hypothetical protein
MGSAAASPPRIFQTMDATELLTALEATLTEPLANRGLALSILGTEEDALELLAVAPTGGRVLLIADEITMGDSGDDQAAGIADFTLRFLVQVPQGMGIKPGHSLYKEGVLAAPALLVQSRELRGLVCRCVAPGRTDFDNQFGFRFQADRPYKPAGELGLRTREVTFRTTGSLDMPGDGAAFDLFES